METGVYWRFDLPEEVQKRTAKGGRGVANLIAINLLEVLETVMTAYFTIDTKRERPLKSGEAALMRADNEAAVTWVRSCHGAGKKQARVGASMRIMGALEARRGWCFHAGHVREVDNSLADCLTRWQEGQNLEQLNAEYPEIAWQVQELGTGDKLICSEVLRQDTHLEELQLRLEDL